jgi:1-deoxy-D-xylulose-5-phosphate synthase
MTITTVASAAARTAKPSPSLPPPSTRRAPRPTPLLDRIERPADLRRLPQRSLPALAHELRGFLLQSVAQSGGHFAAGLGAVELTIALHYVFDTPRDLLVWDIGHQCYPHKILTGRRDRIGTVRRRGGLSGFLRREESEFDTFGAGHSSTSISAAAGMAAALARDGDARVVAVIGDGGLTAGLAYEALNHAGAMRADLLVVLNDNGMSISPNVGALSESLRDPALARRFFGALGFCYHGPLDGHDLPSLVDALRRLRPQRGPRLLHVRTVKGKGYAPAEAEPVKYHGVSAFDLTRGLLSAASAPTYTDVFGDWVCRAAERDPRLVVITPAMREGSGLVRFAQRFPDRFFDVGIAEQHSVTFAAGLATQGWRPIVAIYSTFLQRAVDQVVHDVALQRLPVVFAIDRAGLVGPDGATHNGSYDLTFLRAIPDMAVMTPSDADELCAMLATALACGQPAAVRYPRAVAPRAMLGSDALPAPLPLGRARVCRSGRGVALLAFGATLAVAEQVAAAFDATVADMRFVKPLDGALIEDLAASHRLLVTLEENVASGGAGAAVLEHLNARRLSVEALVLALPDRPLEHGTRDEVLAAAGLDAASVRAAIEARLAAPR